MKLHEIWEIKSINDLRSAKKLSAGEDKILDTAIYHTQQSVEKILKAYLAFSNQEIPKTHDLEILVKRCSKLDVDIKKILDKVIVLTPYATEYRYPDIEIYPDENEVLEAIQISEEIFEFIKSKM